MTPLALVATMGREAIGLMVVLWPISLAVLAAGAVALMAGAPTRNEQFRRRLKVLLITYLFPPLILLIGLIFRYDGPPGLNWRDPPDWYGVPLLGAILAHGGAVIAMPILMKGARLRSLGVLLPGVWFSLCCYFIAAVAIAGVGP